MIIRIIVAIFSIIIILLGLYFLAPLPSDEDLIPESTGAVLFMPHPLDMAMKITDSGLARDFRSIPALTEFFRDIDNLMNQQDNLGIISFLSPEIRMIVPSDLPTKKYEDNPFTFCIKLGRLTRVAKLGGIKNVLGNERRKRGFRGETIYSRDNLSICLLPGYLVFGEEEGVMATILTYKGEAADFGKTMERTGIDFADLDPEADIQIVLSSGAMFEKKKADYFDPRDLIDHTAVLSGVGGLYIDPDMIRANINVKHKGGKKLLTYAGGKPGPFALAGITGDDYYMSGAIRADSMPAILDTILFMAGAEPISGGKLRQKLTRMAFTYVLESMGPEAGFVTPFYNEEGKVLYMQLKDAEKTVQALDKLSANSDVTGNKLAKLLGVDITELSKNPDMAAEMLDQLPEEKRKEAETLIAYWEANRPKKNQITLMGKPFFYRIADNVIYLSKAEGALKKIIEQSGGDKSNQQFFHSLGGVDTDGTVLATWDLLDLVVGKYGIDQPDAFEVFTEQNWKLAFSLKPDKNVTHAKAALGLDVGVRKAQIPVPAKVKVIYYLVTGFLLIIFLAAIYGVYWSGIYFWREFRN